MQPRHGPEIPPEVLERSLGKTVVSTGWQDQHVQGPPLQNQDSEGPLGAFLRTVLRQQSLDTELFLIVLEITSLAAGPLKSWPVIQ